MGVGWGDCCYSCLRCLTVFDCMGLQADSEEFMIKYSSTYLSHLSFNPSRFERCILMVLCDKLAVAVKKK